MFLRLYSKFIIKSVSTVILIQRTDNNKTEHKQGWVIMNFDN